MEHLVRFTTAEGREGHHTAENLDEALKFVEHLRNTEETTAVHLFRLHEVPIEFRTYYRVEVRAGDDAALSAPPAPPADASSLDTHFGPVPEPEPEPESNGRRLFQRT